MQHAAQKVLRARMLRLVEHGFGGSLLDDDSAVNEQHPVGNFLRKTHFVRNHDHRHAVIRQLAHHRQHLADQLRIERRGRLVE